MPTYEYACEACGHKFEEFQSITAAPIKKCPVCKKNKVRRLISAGAGFIFKGSGFYSTDYRSESYKSGAKADATSAGSLGSSTTAGSSSTSTSSTPAKSQTKSEAKTPSKSTGTGKSGGGGKSVAAA